MRRTILFIYYFIFSLALFAQNKAPGTTAKAKNDSIDVDEGIEYYDRFNTFIGGDSTRYCNGMKCSGLIKDLYPNGNLKHKGYYVSGKLTTTYKNYFENGQEERSFQVKSPISADIEIYYKDGKLRVKGDYLKGEPLKWEEYYPNGNMESYEEYTKSLDAYVVSKYFYENGKPQLIIECIDSKKKLYSSKEYYENGQLKEEGKLNYITLISDFQKNGKWIVYDEKGKVTAEENYVKGEMSDDKNY